MSQRSQVAKRGSSPMAQCSAAWAAPARSTSPSPASRSSRHRPPDRGRAQGARGKVERLLPEHLTAGRTPFDEGDDLLGDIDLTEGQPTRPPVPVSELLDDADVGDLAGGGGVARVTGRHGGHAELEVEGVHQPGLASVDVDGAGVGGAVCPAGVDGAHHPARAGLDQLDRGASDGADVGQVAGAVAGGPVPPARPPPQQAFAHEGLEDRPGPGAEEIEVPLDEGQLLGGGAQVGTQHVGVVRIEDGGLDRTAEQRLGVVDQVGVEGVVAGDEHAEGVLRASARSTDLLPERGARPREPRHRAPHRARPRRCRARARWWRRARPAARSADRPRWRVVPRAGSHRDRRPRAGRVAGSTSASSSAAASATCSAPRRDRTNANVRTCSTTRSARRSAVSEVAARRTGAPCSPTNDVRGGSHNAMRDLSAWRGVLAHRPHGEPGQAGGCRLGRGHRRRRKDEGRARPVCGTHPTKAPQDVGDVGAEDPAIVVALVDDHVGERAEEARPSRVVAEQRPVQHVGIGEDVLRVVARPLPLLADAVPVVGRQADVETEVEQRGELVVREGLGGREVEDRRAPLGPRAAGVADRRQCGQLVGQRLAGCGAGRQHDVLAAVSRVRCEDLVPPRTADAAQRERRDHLGRSPPRPVASIASGGGRTSRWVSRPSRTCPAESRRPGPETSGARWSSSWVTERFSQSAPTGPRLRRP